jgi:anthranilate phosphoribosyltransferase
MSDAFKPLLAKLADGQTLDEDDAEIFFAACLRGEPTPAQVAAAVTAMRLRGETVGEITACARAMRRAAVHLEHPYDVIDVCGTGGDGLHTLNISTAVGFVAAGGGLKVAKHGNRAITSKSGTADVLAALGVNIDASRTQQRKALDDGRHLLPVRPGPPRGDEARLADPPAAGFPHHLQPAGPADQSGRRQAAGGRRLGPALRRAGGQGPGSLGAERAWSVHGAGMDELTTTGETEVAEWRDGRCACSRSRPRPSACRAPRCPTSPAATRPQRRRPDRPARRPEGRLSRHRHAQRRRRLPGRRQGRDPARGRRTGRRRASTTAAPRPPSPAWWPPPIREAARMTDILAKIAAYKREDVADRKRRAPSPARRAARRPVPRGFKRRPGGRHAPGRLALIAEIKKASPSKGLIRADFDPPALADAYASRRRGVPVGADRRSQLPGRRRLSDRRPRGVALPCIRKDFLVDPWQVAESRALGADAILVILAMIDDALAADLMAEAARLGMDALVEVHDEAEMDRAGKRWARPRRHQQPRPEELRGRPGRHRAPGAPRPRRTPCWSPRAASSPTTTSCGWKRPAPRPCWSAKA